MRKMRQFLLALVAMFVTAALVLLLISVLTYMYKWKADKALIGITAAYILSGFMGGFLLKIQRKEEKSIGRKMLEAMVLSIAFMVILVAISIFAVQIPFTYNSRFLMIFMLFTGSACLGRIL